MSTHKKLMTLFSKAYFDAQQRHELVYIFTNGRTKSTTQLTPGEIDRLCYKLENDSRFTATVDAQFEMEKRKKRSVILTIATRTGIHDPNDWSKFNSFMVNSSRLKKQLNKYELLELDDLIKQFRGLEANYKKSSKKFGTKANFHHFNLPEISIN